MQRRPWLLLTIGVVFAAVSQSPATPPETPCGLLPKLSQWCGPRSLLGCCACPDDYGARPFPCVVRPPCGGRDDYCPKQFPCVVRPPSGGKDDYCPKKMPGFGPICFPWYRCADGDCGAARPAPCKRIPQK
jgi:hypothetical protein